MLAGPVIAYYRSFLIQGVASFGVIAGARGCIAARSGRARGITKSRVAFRSGRS